MINEVINRLDEYGFFPIVEIADPQKVRPLCDALLSADVPVIEIVLRTAAAIEAIRIVRDEYPEMLLGAGTVLTPEDAKKAADAGARFLLAPGFNPRVIDYCIEHGLTIVPGISTPTLVEWALEKGIEVVKFFPAEASGGLHYLKSMANPFKAVRYVPTGGIGLSNLADYLGFEKVVACGGTWIAKSELIAAGKFDEIARLAEQSRQISLGFNLESIVVQSALDESNSFSRITGLLFPTQRAGSQKNNNSNRGIRIGGQRDAQSQDIIEISTLSIKRAAAYLLRKGFKIVEASSSVDADKKSIIVEQANARYTIRLIEK